MYEDLTAKEMLNKLLEKHYSDAMEAKKAGRPVGWVASNFPQEFIEVFDLDVIYPENQTAAIAARSEAPEMIEESESLGYSSDICSYARVSLGFLERGYSESSNVPMPDFLLCCNNICNQLIKWFENISHELNIPLILVDVPFNNDYEVTESRIEYMKGQVDYLIKSLEEISGKKFDPEKFKKIQEISNETSRQWRRVESLAQKEPSPVNGFYLFNYMALMVCARGKESTRDCIKKYADELEELYNKGESQYKGEQKHRIMMEGIACWPYLRHNSKYLNEHGINLVGSIYIQTWGRIYSSLEEMLYSYSNVPDGINLERAVDRRLDIARKSKCDGILVHMNRSCKIWDGFLLEMVRRVSEELDIPYAIFDGDQADPSKFSKAQFETRVQGLNEIMDARKEVKIND